MDDLLPSHFKGWNPKTSHYFDKLNKEWATNPKFKQLGNCFENFLLKAFENHDNSKLSINKIALQNALTKGEIHSFEGPIYNQQGELMVPEGEVADDGMLLGMNWYVKGIDGELPQ